MVAGSEHEHLVVGTNLAFLAAWCDAAAWPDIAFVERWLYGFPIVGDIPDSGLFRPQELPPTEPADTFSPSNNSRWCDEVIRKVAGAANHPSTERPRGSTLGLRADARRGRQGLHQRPAHSQPAQLQVRQEQLQGDGALRHRAGPRREKKGACHR